MPAETIHECECGACKGGEAHAGREYHRQMGHLNMSDVRKVVKELGIEEAPHPYQQLEDEDPFWCECCILGKMTRKPNREPATRRATRLIEFLHIDVVGP